MVASCTGVAVVKPRPSSTASVRLLMHLSCAKGRSVCRGAARSSPAAVMAALPLLLLPLSSRCAARREVVWCY
jgi:hypothetical protein